MIFTFLESETLGVSRPDPLQVSIRNARTPTTDLAEQSAQTDAVPIVEVTETLPATAPDSLTWVSGQITALAVAPDKS